MELIPVDIDDYSTIREGGSNFSRLLVNISTIDAVPLHDRAGTHPSMRWGMPTKNTGAHGQHRKPDCIVFFYKHLKCRFNSSMVSC